MTREAIKTVREALEPLVRFAASLDKIRLHDNISIGYESARITAGELRKSISKALALLAAEQAKASPDGLDAFRERCAAAHADPRELDCDNSAKAPPDQHANLLAQAEVIAAKDREIDELRQAKAPPDRERLAEKLFEHVFRRLQPRLDGKHTWATADEETRQGFRDEITALRLSPVTAGEWQPTHRHYKGGLYRETKRGRATGDKPITDLTPVVVYENEKGDVLVRAIEEFDGEHGMPTEFNRPRRYQPLPPSSKEAGR